MGERRHTSPQRLGPGDTLNTGSSTGWTDEKHMRYITSLEESFVNQLYSGIGKTNCGDSFDWTPGVQGKTSYNGNGRNTKSDQGYPRLVKVDEAESRLSEVEHTSSPCGSLYYMDDDASTNGPRQARSSYHARHRSSGGSTAFHLRQHSHSCSWITESSGQNFVETQHNREQGRGSSKKREPHDVDTAEFWAGSPGSSDLQ